MRCCCSQNILRIWKREKKQEEFKLIIELRKEAFKDESVLCTGGGDGEIQRGKTKNFLSLKILFSMAYKSFFFFFFQLFLFINVIFLLCVVFHGLPEWIIMFLVYFNIRRPETTFPFIWAQDQQLYEVRVSFCFWVFFFPPQEGSGLSRWLMYKRPQSSCSGCRFNSRPVTLCSMSSPIPLCPDFLSLSLSCDE